MAKKPSDVPSTDTSGPAPARHRSFLMGIAAAGLLLSAVLTFVAVDIVRQNEYARIEGRMADLAGRVETEFEVELASVRALAAFIETHPEITPDDFLSHAKNLRVSKFGIASYGWAPRAPSAQGSQPVAYRINILVPDIAAPGLLDMNLLEQESVRDVLLDSAQLDETQVTDLLPGEIIGIPDRYALALSPYYDASSEAVATGPRLENVRGVVVAVLDVRDAVGSVVGANAFVEQMRDGDIAIEVVGEDEQTDGAVIYRNGNGQLFADADQASWLDPVSVSERDLRIAQRYLRLRMAVGTAGLGMTPYFVGLACFFAGLVLTGGLLIYAWSRMSDERRVNALVAARTTALQKSEQRLRDMADVSADWFWEMDRDFRFTELSARFEEVTGISRDLFLGRTRMETAGLGSAVSPGGWDKHLEALQNHETFNDFRYKLTKENGKEEFFSISGKPVYDENGTFDGYIGTGRNVTMEEVAHHRLQESETRLQRNVHQLEMSQHELEESTAQMTELAERYAIEKDRAEASERSKSEFLASMSHEIRTPMTGVMGFADMLLDSNLAPENRDKVLKIKGATQSLLTIINDILDLSKLDAGRLKIENLDFNLKTAIEEVVDLVRERARVKNLKLDIDFPDDMSIGMNGDPTRFRQVLINLVGNAVKFTHKGGVTIRARRSGSGADSTVEFRVIDTGIGISKENQRKLFSDFSQADGSITRNYEGTGLGLAISKRLVELMGGTIWIESEEGAGSEFCFTLPFREATSDVSNETRMHHAEHFKTLRPLSVLVAEDNKLNQRIIVATLEKFGHDVDVVDNGEQAIHQLGEGEYDLVLMDIRMPGMSGTDATRAIRGRGDRLADIPVIALTADAMEEHIRGYYEAGMNAVATKPIDQVALVTTINEVLGEDIHVPQSDAEVARAGYALPGEDEAVDDSGEQTKDQSGVISVSEFLKELDGVANDIEGKKGANK